VARGNGRESFRVVPYLRDAICCAPTGGKGSRILDSRKSDEGSVPRGRSRRRVEWSTTTKWSHARLSKTEVSGQIASVSRRGRDRIEISRRGVSQRQERREARCLCTEASKSKSIREDRRNELEEWGGGQTRPGKYGGSGVTARKRFFR